LFNNEYPSVEYVVLDASIVKLLIEEQFTKEWLVDPTEILVTPLPIIRDVKPVHPLNAVVPIVVTFDPSVTFVIPVYPEYCEVKIDA
jgi:hypothetical protein